MRVLATVVAGMGLFLGGAGAREWAPEAFTLEPKVEELWSQWMDEARPRRVIRETERMAGQMMQLKKQFGLDEKAEAELKAAVPGVVAEAVRHWEQFLRKLFRPGYQGGVEDALAAMKRLKQEPAALMAGHEVRFDHLPHELEGFVGAVKKVLPAEVFGRWNKERLERAEKRRKQARDWLEAGEKAQEPGKLYARPFEAFLEEAAAVLDVKGGEYKALEKQVAEWAEAYVERCRELSLLRLDSFLLNGPGWKEAEKRGYYLSLAPRPKVLAKQVEVLRAMMPEPAKTALAAMVKAREERARVARVKVRVMVVEHVVTLSDAQRAAVEGLAGTLPVRAGDPIAANQVDPAPWRDWEGEALKQLNAILDDEQERLWAQGVAGLAEGRSRMQMTAAKGPPRHPVAGPADAAEMEAVISGYVAEEAREQGTRSLPKLMRQVDEVARVAGLDAETRAVLELAAKGTLQQALEMHWKNQARFVRSQVQGATAMTIRQRLVSLGGYSFQVNQNAVTLLEETIQQTLSESQRAAVAAHQGAERRRRDEAIVSLILLRLDGVLRLDELQHGRLRALLMGVMEEYGPDIEQNFMNWGERTPWFFQSYYLMIPGSGVEEKRLEEVLNARQRGLWDENVTSRGGHYWGEIQQYHEQRKGVKQPGANGGMMRIR
jgi:hypothetical protein